jgi:nicotinate-nucleotide adenylyltransferase
MSTFKRIGIFGGSFNPIHCGHVNIASWIVEHNYVDEVWLMISPQNPLKEAANLMPEQERMALAQLALENIKGVKASDFEWSLPRPSYTWSTLCALRKAYPDTEFYLIIGGDNWVNFNQWANTDLILSSTPILVYPRPNSNINTAELPERVTLLSGAPRFPYSSTQVRESLRSGHIPTDMLPHAVANKLCSKL